MGYSTDTLVGYKRSGSLGSLTVTGANETLLVVTPYGISSATLQGKNLTNRESAAMVWVPVGVWYTVTTDIAAAAAKVTLRKNSVSPLSGGVATLPALVAVADEQFAPFTSWKFAAPPAPGDVWSILVTTVSDTTGIINPCYLAYANGAYTGVTDAIAV
jgi:hypothetical protein